jgi:hypothetical protein
MKAEGFEPRFDRDMERGQVGEELLDLLFEDSKDPSVRIEVKTDYKTNKTGNIYVETHKFRDGKSDEAVPSGINVTESKWWGQASPDGTAILLIKTEALRKYIDIVEPPKSAQPISNAHSAASLGLLVSMKGLMKYLKMWKSTD